MAGTELKITDGTTTLTFDGTTDGRVVQYDPATPGMRVVDVEHATEEGQELTEARYRNVHEKAELFLEGTETAIGAKANTLQRMLEQARRSNRDHVENRVFVQLKPDGYSSWYESEIFNGTYAPERDGVGLWLGRGKMSVDVEWTRRYYWEAVTEAQLTLYQPSGSGTTRTVYNGRDGTRYNYVDVLNTSISGDLPSPIRLNVLNNSSVAQRRIWVGNKYTGDASTFVDTLDAEDASGFGGSGSFLPGTPDTALYSQGQYWSYTFNSTSEALILRWTLASAQTTAARGGFFKILCYMNVKPATDTFKVRARLYMGANPIWVGPWVYPNRTPYELLDLGSLRIPPFPARSGSLYPVDLWLNGQLESAGSYSTGTDFVRLIPLDYWRQYDSFAADLGNGVTLTDDPYDEWVYTSGWASSGRAGNFNVFGPKLMLVKGASGSDRNRFVFTTMRYTGEVYAGDNCTVSMYYRPRRLSL